MEIVLQSPACIAVDQSTLHAAIRGTQLGGNASLLVLIKSEHPTADVASNKWSVVSTTPTNYFSSDTYNWITDTTCSVDKNGVFTLRFIDGSGYRYDPMAPKSSNTQTCSANGSRSGEWRRTHLVSPVEPALSRAAVVILTEIGSSSSNNGGYSEGDEMAIYKEGPYQQRPPAFRYARIDKNAYINTLTSTNISKVSIGEKSMMLEELVYGDGQMYSVYASATQISEQDGNRTIYNRTLAYFPFEPPFLLTSPPTSSVYVPWDHGCDHYGSFSIGAAAKGKLYYLCAALDSLSYNDKVFMYIYDSKTRQSQGPFTLPNNMSTASSYNDRLLPVYSTTEQNEPRFLVVNVFPLQKMPGLIDLQALGNGSSQFWTEFKLPTRLEVDEGLGPSCRTREGTKRLIRAGILSGVFVVVAAIFVFIRLRRRHRANQSADKTSLWEDLMPEFLHTSRMGVGHRR